MAQIRQFGSTTLHLPPLGLGMAHAGGIRGRLPAAIAQKTLPTASGGGIRYLDTAPWDGRGRSERRLGRVPVVQPGCAVRLLYRGIQPALTVIAGERFLYGAAVCISPDALRPDQMCLQVSPTPDAMQLQKRK